jgi:hypothetical protein
MDQNEATTTTNEQPQCQNLDECSPEMTPVPPTTQQSSSMPSVEKRRRRLQQAAAERRSSDNRHVGHSNERQWLDQSTAIVVGALLFLILILQKGERDPLVCDIISSLLIQYISMPPRNITLVRIGNLTIIYIRQNNQRHSTV